LYVKKVHAKKLTKKIMKKKYKKKVQKIFRVGVYDFYPKKIFIKKKA